MKKTKKFIWDYDVSKMNFDDPEVLKWYLKRKIEFGDWEAIDRKTLKKYLPELDLDHGIKHLLWLFVYHENIPQSSPEKISPRVAKK